MTSKYTSFYAIPRKLFSLMTDCGGGYGSQGSGTEERRRNCRGGEKDRGCAGKRRKRVNLHQRLGAFSKKTPFPLPNTRSVATHSFPTKKKA